jgi:hypothetical protein
MPFSHVGSSGGSSGIIAKTIASPPETVVAFDGFELKWHNGTATSFDGVAIRFTGGGTRNMTYSVTEWYLAAGVHDSGHSTWGTANCWYTLPTALAAATTTSGGPSTATYPHTYPLGATFVGFGNPRLPQDVMREYILEDRTANKAYKITIKKNASTGEVAGPQTGTCTISVMAI